MQEGRLLRLQELLRGRSMSEQEMADAINLRLELAKPYIAYLIDSGCVRKDGCQARRRGKRAPLYRWNAGAVMALPGAETKQIAKAETSKPLVNTDPLMAALFAPRRKPRA